MEYCRQKRNTGRPKGVYCEIKGEWMPCVLTFGGVWTKCKRPKCIQDYRLDTCVIINGKLNLVDSDDLEFKQHSLADY